MIQTLSLIFCVVFVLWLLIIEHKHAPHVSHALWIPTIWMLLIASKPLGIWFGIGGTDMESGSSVDRAFLGGILFLGLLILVKRQFNWSRAIKESPWLILLIGYMLVSIFWSDIPFISFKRWVREFVAVIMAFLVLTEQAPRQAIESVLRRSVYILIPFSVILIKYFPYYGRDYGRWSGMEMWTGVTLQKNGLGRLCIISAFFLIWTFVRKWRKPDMPVGNCQTYAEGFLLVVTLVLMKGPPGAYSATAVGSLAAGLSAFVGLLMMRKGRMNLGANTLKVITLLIISYGVVIVFIGGSTLGGIASSLGRDSSLTGRTAVWAELLPVAMQRSILGHGFGGFWSSSSRKVYKISEGHSGYLDTLLDLGFIGLLFLSIFLLSCCRRAQKVLLHDYDWGCFWICFLLMVLIHNISETSFPSLSSHLMAVLLFLYISSTATNSYNLRIIRKV